MITHCASHRQQGGSMAYPAQKVLRRGCKEGLALARERPRTRTPGSDFPYRRSSGQNALYWEGRNIALHGKNVVMFHEMRRIPERRKPETSGRDAFR